MNFVAITDRYGKTVVVNFDLVKEIAQYDSPNGDNYIIRVTYGISETNNFAFKDKDTRDKLYDKLMNILQVKNYVPLNL